VSFSKHEPNLSDFFKLYYVGAWARDPLRSASCRSGGG
jgi:hypothetical protein